MRKVINCECGEAIRASNDDELVAAVQSHVLAHHPDLIGKLSREDILAMSEEEE